MKSESNVAEGLVHDVGRYGRPGRPKARDWDTRDCGSRVYRFENRGTPANARVRANLDIP